MDKEHWGLYGTVIYSEDIPYKGEKLYDCDMIKNSSGFTLMYRKDYNGYFLITNDATDFLPNNERSSQWIKL